MQSVCTEARDWSPQSMQAGQVYLPADGSAALFAGFAASVSGMLEKGGALTSGRAVFVVAEIPHWVVCLEGSSEHDAIVVVCQHEDEALAVIGQLPERTPVAICDDARVLRAGQLAIDPQSRAQRSAASASTVVREALTEAARVRLLGRSGHGVLLARWLIETVTAVYQSKTSPAKVRELAEGLMDRASLYAQMTPYLHREQLFDALVAPCAWAWRPDERKFSLRFNHRLIAVDQSGGTLARAFAQNVSREAALMRVAGKLAS